MKRTVILALVFVGLASYAQEQQYKPVKGNFTTEMQLSFLSINAQINMDYEAFSYSTGPLSMQGLRFRYFISDKVALRATLGMNFNDHQVERNIDETRHLWINPSYFELVVTGESIEKRSNKTFSFAPGLEYHFGDWERMSLYVGGELFFGRTTTSSELDVKTEALMYYQNNSEVYFGMHHSELSIKSKNCVVNYNSYNANFEIYGVRQNAPIFYGINLLMGMDFYIYKSLYMGAEFGLGYTYDTYLKGTYEGSYIQTITPSGGGPVINLNDDSIDEKMEDKISSSNFSVVYNPMIRIGWRF